MAGRLQDLTYIVPDTMIDLDKLNSQLDLKNLDGAQLAKLFKENQNSVIKLGLVIGALFLAVVMYNDFHAKDQAMHLRITQLQQKLDAIKARDGAIKDLDDFQSTLPLKINEFELITLISDYAKSNRITITTLSPAESQNMGLYDLINMNFNAVSDDFKSLMLFLRSIEKSKYPLRVNSWSGQEAADGKVTFDIQISAVLIHP
jgi:hypothetical protein